MGDVRRFVDEHRDDLGEAFGAAGAVFEKAGDLARAKKVDIREILTGDFLADRALLEAAGVQAEIEASGVCLEGALDLAYALLRLGVVVAGMAA